MLRHDSKRTKRYHIVTASGALINMATITEILEQIRQSTRQGLVIGKQRFAQEIEAHTQRRTRPAKSNLKEYVSSDPSSYV